MANPQAMELLTIPLSSLRFDPFNARSHDKRNLEAIKRSLKRFGQQKPIVVNEHNVIVAGNGTATAAMELGWTEIKCVRTRLTGRDQTAYAVADNRTAELASWDMDTLPKILSELDGDGFNVEDIGFTHAELEGLLVAPLDDVDEPEKPDTTITLHECPSCGHRFE